MCFPIDGRPAIVRALDVYRECGIAQPIVVVGAMASQVMETVAAEHEGVVYVYQAAQLGTGHAARLGARALASLGEDEDVLLVAGDRLIEPIALERLFALYYEQDCDLAFMVAPRRERSEQGRVLLRPDGAVLANVEMRDVRQRRGAGPPARRGAGRRPLSRGSARGPFWARWTRPAPAWPSATSGPGWPRRRYPSAQEYLERIPAAATEFTFSMPDGGQERRSVEEVEQATVVNVSVYLARARALRYALDNLNRCNAQREEYLSDIGINLLARGRRPTGAPTPSAR